MAKKIVICNNELYHYGILGQKWGVRRYQNEDGTLTEEGKLRYGYDPQKGLTNIKGPFMTMKKKRQLMKMADATMTKESIDDLNDTLFGDAPSSTKADYLESLWASAKDNPSGEDGHYTSNNGVNFKLNLIALTFDGFMQNQLERVSDKINNGSWRRGLNENNSFRMMDRFLVNHMWSQESKQKWDTMLSMRARKNDAFVHDKDKYALINKQYDVTYTNYLKGRCKELGVPTDKKTLGYLREITRYYEI